MSDLDNLIEVHKREIEKVTKEIVKVKEQINDLNVILEEHRAWKIHLQGRLSVLMEMRGGNEDREAEGDDETRK